VAQDTGSAIVGPARADIYFGAGEEAGLIGGRIKQPGRFAMLLPREIDPFARWRNVPLPPVRPEIMATQTDEPTRTAEHAPDRETATPAERKKIRGDEAAAQSMSTNAVSAKARLRVHAAKAKPPRQRSARTQ
jgi:membrane-bound lytic murein transglycosylase A